MPNPLTYERHCDEIAEQARQFRDTVRAATLDTQVPTCPAWTLRELAVHVGDALRMMARVVETRSAGMPDRSQIPGFGGPGRPVGTDTDPDADAQALDAWLAESADTAVEAMRATAPDTPVWTWSGDRQARFWARRAANELVVHRADAAATAELPFEIDPVVAADCIDEWLEIVSSPAAGEHRRALLALAERAGSTLHLHATDTDGSLEAEWLIALGQDGIGWRRAHEKADVALRGPIADVLLVLQRRLPPSSEHVEVRGDAGLLDLWLDRVRFE